MPHIEDIRVNGQQTTTAPTIAGLHPTISWDYVEDAAALIPQSFEIRFGRQSLDLGTDEYIGDRVSEVVASGSNSFEHTVHNLERAHLYLGQIQVVDSDGDLTPWKTFSFHTNNLPFVTNFTLSPSSPNLGEDVELSYQFNDADKHQEAGTKIRWFRNNLPMSEYDDLCILPARATTAGESWSAKIIPSDGLEFGPIVETSAVTIGDIETSFDTIEILPTDANVDDILKAEFTLTETEYIQTTGVVSFEWFINSASVEDSNNQYMRLDLSPGDSVAVVLTLTDTDGTVTSQTASDPLVIQDVDWVLLNFTVNELRDFVNIGDLSPILEWNIHKTTAGPSEFPAFLRAVVTKTPSLGGPIFDTGVIQYTKNSFVIPDDILSKGQTYFLHIGASDTSPIPDGNFLTKRINIAGSSWSENVDSTKGWTVETKMRLAGDAVQAFGSEGGIDTAIDLTGITPTAGIYIHDGTYFCSVTFGLGNVTFHSDTSLVFTLPSSISDNRTAKTFRISGKGQDIKIFMDNKLILDAVGLLTNTSQLKQLEYGDINGKYLSESIFNFFRYTTIGAMGFGDNLPNENTFFFSTVGEITGGTIQYVLNGLIAWLPDDLDESAKLIRFNENSEQISLPTVATNFSPITSIFVDSNRNKYIGTANGVSAIFGEKHSADYEFDTSGTDVVITSKDFDRITTVPSDKIAVVEPDNVVGWFSIDTTFRTVGEIDLSRRFKTGDPYDPYIFGIDAHAIHYYTQRAPGHAWYDQVDNKKGWQLSFTFDLDLLEQDDFINQEIDHKGFGIFINDGTYQEIIFFYEDRIRLFYANVFVPIVTTTPREYRIVGKDNSLLIYQKLDIPSITSYQLLINGTGLFTTPAAATGNSRKPRLVFDAAGLYHAVWHDDGNGRSQIFYSVYDGTSWSNPEVITRSFFNHRNPDIAIDTAGRVWVVYEDTSWGETEISVSVLDNAGWNKPTRITNHRSKKSNPSIIIDAFDNVHIVWEDNRNGVTEIFWAERQTSRQAWISSGQFGEDTVVMTQNDANDPYIEGSVYFSHPRLAYLHPNIWLVAQGVEQRSRPAESDHFSAIYLGFRDIEDGFWSSSGVPRFIDGTFIVTGQSQVISSPNRKSVNPDIAMSDSLSTFAVVWEDQTEPISQIWGATFGGTGLEVLGATKITDRPLDCKNPVVGFTSKVAPILFESGNEIFMANYNSDSFTFNGTGQGDDDVLIDTGSEKIVSRPALAKTVPAANFICVYDFLRKLDGTISDTEFPDFYLIGDASVSTSTNIYPLDLVNVSTLANGMVSNLDTKEFAFGDMSENIGLRAHWKNIKMYFGYGAKPHSIGEFNSNTVVNWGDNRVTDLFVDVFGNLIIGKFDGLVYHNVFTGELTKIQGAIANKLITAVSWGGNGAWYVGTNTGLYISTSAGQTWTQFAGTDSITINRIAIDRLGNAICATSDGIRIASPNGDIVAISLIDLFGQQVPGISASARAIAIDENDIIWVGTDRGLGRIENKQNGLFFSHSSGMRSSHVTDIAIVNKSLRYISTASGIDKMYGTTFQGLSTSTHDLISNNVARLKWVEETQSLWAASMHVLHEIVFRDPVHDIIEDEVVQYDSTELLTDTIFSKTVYTVLDLDEVGTSLKITPESTSVLINKNKIDLGFAVGEGGQNISFLTELLPRDEVEILVSNKFIEEHDFNQTGIEKKVVGEKRIGVGKIVQTIELAQNLVMTNQDRSQILLDGGKSNLPFTSILLDRVKPFGSLEQLDTLTTTTLRFQIFAHDVDSGIDGYILSNFENFTSDGETPQNFTTFPIDGIVTHDLGAGLTNVTTSLLFPATTLIGVTTETVGTGAALTTWMAETAEDLLNLGITNQSPPVIFLFAATSSPVIMWRFNPATETWTSIAKLSAESDRVVNLMHRSGNVIYVATGRDGGVGTIFRSVDGETFTPLFSSTSGSHFLSISNGTDGTVYVGDDAGDIYSINGDQISLKWSSIGDSVNSLAVWQNLVIAGTGNKGRVFVIDRETNDSFIAFAGLENDIDHVHIKDVDVSSPSEAIIYAGSGDFTTIYRGNLDTFDFIKSFSSVNKSINRIQTVSESSLEQLEDGAPLDVVKVVSAVGNSLFKHNEPAWEFFYKNDDDIVDFLEYGAPNVNGLYLISDSKITKWTNVLQEKIVYMRLRDKAGNISAAPIVDPDNPCPTDTLAQCSNFSYSINIKDLQTFINEARIVNIDEYGVILFTHDSFNDRSFYSADEIDEETGIYVSEVLNGSNDIVSWKSLTWDSTEPANTSVNVQIRNGVTESDAASAEWSANLVKGANGLVSIEHITDQYLQFRVILKSQTRDISPTLTSVTIRNLTTQASHFFTTNFILPSRPIKGLLTANTFIPVSADVVFGINTKNSVDFGDYQIIEANRLFTTTQGQFGEDFRIGAKLLSPGIPQLTPTSNPGDPYDASSFVCNIDFGFTNDDVTYKDFHFRVRFYNDLFRTQLIHTFFSGNDQTGWSFGSGSNNFPATGLTIGPSESANVVFGPLDRVESNQKWYITVEAYDGIIFETVLDDQSYICSECNITNIRGLISEYYLTGLPGTLTSAPQFSSFTPDHTLLEDNLFFPTRFTNWVTTQGQVLAGFTDNFAARFRGKIQAPSTGVFGFELQSTDGSILFIDGEEVIDHDGIHGFTTASGSVSMTEGFHDIEVHYFDGTGSEAGLDLRWTTPGETVFVTVPLQRFFHAEASEYCDDTLSPKLFNLGILLELEGGETVKLNLTP